MKIKPGVVVWALCVGMVSISQAQAPAADGKAAAEALPESHPLVQSWVPPVYPAELKAAKTTGNVTVHFIVDDKGAVNSVRAEKSSDPRFEAAAVESVSKWTFEPGVEMGVRTAMGMSVKLHFKLPERAPGLLPPDESTPKPLPRTDAKAEANPNPDYPPDLLARLIGGRAIVDFVVEADGRITNVRLLGVNHPGFVRPVLAAVGRLTFTPAKQGDLAVADKIRSPIEFEPFVASVDEVKPHLETNGFEVRLAEGQTQRDLFNRPPVLWDVPDVVYPRAAAVAGTEGEAVVDFELDERGNPENIRLVSASAPEFGQVIIDTLASGTFKPAMKDGRTVGAPLRWKYVFKQPAAEPVDGETPEDRLIRLLKSGQVIASAKGLDAPLKPLWRVAAIYPKELRAEGLKGTVDVEFIIDSEGRVRLPYAIKASDERFGRAAVIAASLWVFDPPTRGGQPADVRVRLPFQFAP